MVSKVSGMYTNSNSPVAKKLSSAIRLLAYAIAIPSPMWQAPTTAKRDIPSVAIVQALLELHRRKLGKPQCFEGARPVAQVAPQKSADDRQ